MKVGLTGKSLPTKNPPLSYNGDFESRLCMARICRPEARLPGVERQSADIRREGGDTVVPPVRHIHRQV